MDEYLTVSTHNFKNNISRYIRMLERGERRAVLVTRKGKTVGAFIPLENTYSEDDARKSSPPRPFVKKSCYKKE